MGASRHARIINAISLSSACKLSALPCGALGALSETGISISDDDVWALYSLPHETVHLVQAITSPRFFEFNRELTRMAIRAAHFQAKGEQLPSGMKVRFQTLQASIQEKVYGFSAHEILETQAVIEGFWVR